MINNPNFTPLKSSIIDPIQYPVEIENNDDKINNNMSSSQ